MKLLVNIRGTNGSGKSIIPMSMLDDTEMRVECVRDDERNPRITVFPQYRWVALGTYYTRTGGMDTFKNNADTYDAMRYALENYPEYDIMMEGIMASTIYSTYRDWFKDLSKEFNRKVIILNFVPPLDVCLERIQERNGGIPIKEELVESKWNTVRRNADKFADDGFTSLVVNNERTPKNKMLLRFLNLCNKYREV